MVRRNHRRRLRVRSFTLKAIPIIPGNPRGRARDGKQGKNGRNATARSRETAHSFPKLTPLRHSYSEADSIILKAPLPVVPPAPAIHHRLHRGLDSEARISHASCSPCATKL
jgi:hypothetical protein